MKYESIVHEYLQHEFENYIREWETEDYSEDLQLFSELIYIYI